MYLCARACALVLAHPHRKHLVRKHACTTFSTHPLFVDILLISAELPLLCWALWRQHVASRVVSLPDLVQRVNDFRAITGGGFSFLKIPRTYYGLLSAAALQAASKDAGPGLAPAQAESVLKALVDANLMDDAGAVSEAVQDKRSSAGILDNLLSLKLKDTLV